MRRISAVGIAALEEGGSCFGCHRGKRKNRRLCSAETVLLEHAVELEVAQL